MPHGSKKGALECTDRRKRCGQSLGKSQSSCEKCPVPAQCVTVCCRRNKASPVMTAVLQDPTISSLLGPCKEGPKPLTPYLDLQHFTTSFVLMLQLIENRN